MVRREASIVPSGGEEVRIPPACLAEMGLADGDRVFLEATPGRLLLTPFWDLRAVRSDLGTIASDLEEARARLRRVAGLLPEPLEPEIDTPDISPDISEAPGARERFTVGIELLGTLQCILADDLDPALAKLQEAVALTLGQMEESG